MEVMNFSFIKKGIPNPLKRIENPQLQAALLALVISLVAWIGVSLFYSLAPFGNKILCTSDGSSQYIPFLCEFWSVFHEGGSLLYSFHGGLGNNFYLTFTYYLLSPFTFLVLFFDKTQIPMVSNLIVILKNILVITVMAWYLASKSEKPKPFLAMTLAIAYGFSYYFLGYSFNFMWMDGIALVPLMLYGMERITTRKGKIIYTVSLALAILTNFYMGAVICIFLALYYLVMELKLNKDGWEHFLTFSLCSICAALIAGVVLIPVIKGLLFDNTSRMSSPEWEIYNNTKYFFSRFLPQAEIVKVSQNRGTINLYMGVAPVFGILLFLFTKQKSKREKYGLLFLIGVYLLSTQFSLLNYVFHGFYLQRGCPNRYSFIINFLIVVGTYDSFSNIYRDSSNKIILAGVISAWFFGVISAWNTDNSLKVTLILSGLSILYLIMAFYKKMGLILLIILMESLYSLTHLSLINVPSSFLQMENYMSALETISTIGRTEVVGDNVNKNSPFVYGYNGVAIFNSISNPRVIDFMGKIGYSSSASRYHFTRGWTPISALFLGVQNIISNSKSVLIPDPYLMVNQINNLEIYEFPYPISIGIIPIKNEILESENKFQNLNTLYPNSFSLIDLGASISGAEETNKSEIYNRKYKLKNIKKNDVINLYLDSFTSEEAYIYSYMNSSESFKVFKNNNEIQSVDSNGFITYLGSVKKEDEIIIQYKSSSNSSSRTITLQAATLSSTKINEAGEYYSSHCLKEPIISGVSLSGIYEISSPENMVFTIPYDEGWTAYVNGKQVAISPWQEAFLSIPLQSGKNEIKLTFFPLGLQEGIVASLSGLLLLWVLVKKF